MYKNRLISYLGCILLLAAISSCARTKEPVDYVNPYMGNISHLLVPTFPTVHLPNSMLRVYPQRHDYTGDKLNGLPIITTNHRERSAFGIYPLRDTDSGDYKPQLSYDQEELKPYFYKVFLDDLGLYTEYAPSHQSAIYSFKNESSQPFHLAINTKDGVIEYNDGIIKGYERLANTSTKVYLYLELEHKPLKVDKVASGSENIVVASFSEGIDKLSLRYGISYISTEQAEKNLHREIKDYDLDNVASSGRRIWNETLGKIAVKGSDEDAKTVFYTSLYRTYERMINMSEDGNYYSPFDGKIHKTEGHDFYNDDWIWDTYRATHPLRVIIEPKVETDILNSYIRMAEQMEEFWMPTFPEVIGDTRRMNSNHAVATVLDAYTKGLRDFDLKKAYEASYNAITEKTLAPWSGAKAGHLDDFFKQNGYFPSLAVGEVESVAEVNSSEKRQAVAVTLGTVYDQWCLSQIARLLDKKDDYSYFLNRSLNYKTIFNPQTRFFHPKDEKGNFIEPFDYVRSGGMGARDYYGENNGWIYRWDVPHNIEGLIELMGGKEAFIHELDRMYNEPLGDAKFNFYAQLPDHTGNVGQFSMANEPSLHIPYLYNYAGQPWKTQKRVRTLLKQWFRNDLMGIPGDEDGGGMSAFVVFSSLGFYPVTPGLPMYVIGSPVFEEATVDIGNGKQFKIICQNYSPNNKYIQSAILNGKTLNRSWFSHQELMQGGILEFVMGEKANKSWATTGESLPPSFEMKQ